MLERYGRLYNFIDDPPFIGRLSISDLTFMYFLTVLLAVYYEPPIHYRHKSGNKFKYCM